MRVGQPVPALITHYAPLENLLASFGSITFSGQSGEKYLCHAWPLETRFKPIGAVYLVTKRMANKTYARKAGHQTIFVGQTESLANPLATETEYERFIKYGANCVCVYVHADAERRLAVERDLIAGHQPFCN
jgi:hypothetical protein